MNSDKIVTGIIGKLKQAYANMVAAYFVFGDGVLALRKHGYSWTEARRVILDAFPNAKAETGLTLSEAWLKGAAAMAEAFAEDEGLASPDGKHRVSREDITTLGLSDKQRQRMTDLLAYSDSKAAVKGTPKLRVSDLAKAVRQHANAETASEKHKVVQALLDRFDEVDGVLTLVDAKDERGIIEAQIAELNRKIAAAEDKLEALRNQRSELRAKLPAQPQAQGPERVTAPVTEEVMEERSKRSSRVTGAPAKPAIQAQAGA